MGSFKKFLKEAGGQEAGKLEMDKMSLDQAISFLKKNNFDISNIPDFEDNFKKAKSLVKKGKTKRKDMPVIDSNDVKKFQTRLEKGNLDINKPFAKDRNPQNPFPEGLSGTKAKEFLERGLKDGSKNDDEISVSIKKKKVSILKPIQKQIYFDKSMKKIMNFGVKKSKEFIQNKSFFITSDDDYIIDGHHRFLSAVLLDPSMTINALSIDLPIKDLLPLSLAYGDAIGNKRNA